MTDPTQDMLCLQDFDETIAEFYRMVAPKVPWGDFGSILVHGMTSYSAPDTRPPELLRAGPFVPPISFPTFCVVVTEVVRNELEFSGLTGFSFIPAIKKVTVSINWHEWDLLGEEPQFYPNEGEPENYISEEEHSAELAKHMPDLWRLVIPRGAKEIREPPRGAGNPLDFGQVFIRANSWQGTDFFSADITLFNYVSPRARQWLLDRYPAWLAFRPVLTK